MSSELKVYTYEILDESNNKLFTHWADGLKMILEKDGQTIKLDGDEIQKIVKSLPKTIGGVY